MKPNLYLLGAAKSGTPALATFLSEHPAIFISISKEPGWFADDWRRGHGVGEVLMREQADYDRLFEGADAPGIRYALDASTVYLKSNVAVANILAYRPDAKFIVSLRDPVAMAHAFHMEAMFNGLEDIEDFETAWNLQEERRQGRSMPAHCRQPKRLQYRQVCSVGTQLEKARQQIPDGALLVTFQDDLGAEPEAVWTRILSFLDLPPCDIDLRRKVASAHFVRFPALARIYHRPEAARMVRGGRALLRVTGTTGLAKKVLAKKGKRPPMRPEFEARLRAEFQSEVEKLEALTGRNLTAWKPS